MKYLIILMFSMTSLLAISKNNFEIRFGVLEYKDSAYDIVEQRLSFSKSEEIKFGPIICPTSNEELQYQFKLIYKESKEGVSENHILIDTNGTINPIDRRKGKSKSKGKGRAIVLSPEDEDPIGVYQSIIYINGELKEVFEFTLTP